MPRHDWRHGLIAAGIVQRGAPAVDELLGILEAGVRSLDVRDLRDPNLSRDEAWLLRALGSLQHGRESEAMLELAARLPPAAIRLALPPARALARELAAVGLELSCSANGGARAAAASAAAYPDPGLSLVQ
jgi:hypothetical protein